MGLYSFEMAHIFGPNERIETFANVLESVRERIFDEVPFLESGTEMIGNDAQKQTESACIFWKGKAQNEKTENMMLT
jgi:hypothetical protein